MRWEVAALVLACGVAGCEADTYRLPEYNFGKGVQYLCVDVSDPMCDGVQPDVTTAPGALVPMPAIGLGSVFDIESGIVLTRERLEPGELGGIQAVKVGLAAVSVSDDFAHLEVREPVDIRVTHDEQRNLFQNVVGSADFPLRFPEDRFRVELIDEYGFALAGSFPCNWESDDPDVVRVISDPRSNLVTFRIEGSGQTILRVTMGDFVQEIDFNITIN